MSTTKHTPGPWEVGASLRGRHGDTSQTIVLGDPQLVPRINRPHGRKRDLTMVEPNYLVCVAKGHTLDASVANARLIAAAPEMLEALKLALPLLERTDISANAATAYIFTAARAAIAKAEGRE